MKKILLPVLALSFCVRLSAFAASGGPQLPKIAVPQTSEDVAAKDERQNSVDLFDLETTYNFSSDFKDSRFGDGDSWHNDFSYDHRFHVTGNWYFRTGIEYERYDFGNGDNGLPDHLQALYGHLAYEYVVHDFPGIALILDPGMYWQNRITADAFDIPWKIYSAIPLKKNKIYGIIGVAGGLMQDPPVAPGGGLIVVFNDKVRLQGVFPKPALVYTPNEDWELKLLGELYYVSFRTDDVNTPAGNMQLHNAVVQYSEDRAGASISYRGIPHLKIITEGGCTFLRNFDFFRSNQSIKSDPAPYIRAGLEFRF